MRRRCGDWKQWREPANEERRVLHQVVDLTNFKEGEMSAPQAGIQRPPLPPFSRETATQKGRLGEDAGNSGEPEKMVFAYAADSRWRNRAEFLNGRQEIVEFLKRKWS